MSSVSRLVPSRESEGVYFTIQFYLSENNTFTFGGGGLLRAQEEKAPENKRVGQREREKKAR